MAVRHERRIVKAITIRYRYEDEDESQEHELQLTHDGDGEYVDGVVWSGDLIRRLHYPGSGTQGCVPVTRRTPPQPRWKFAGSSPRLVDHCLWLHEEDCSWSEYCTGPD